MPAANTKRGCPGEEVVQLVVTKPSNRTSQVFFVCCAAVKHRRTAALLPCSTPSVQETRKVDVEKAQEVMCRAGPRFNRPESAERSF